MLNSCESIVLTPKFFGVIAQNYCSKEQGLTHQQLFVQWMTEHEKLLRHIITGFEAKARYSR